MPFIIFFLFIYLLCFHYVENVEICWDFVLWLLGFALFAKYICYEYMFLACQFPWRTRSVCKCTSGSILLSWLWLRGLSRMELCTHCVLLDFMISLLFEALPIDDAIHANRCFPVGYWHLIALQLNPFCRCNLILWTSSYYNGCNGQCRLNQITFRTTQATAAIFQNDMLGR